jgi:hypothetical protein
MWWRGERVDVRRLLHYLPLLQAHEKMWHEAMLTAALWFLFDEIGMREVFYHSWSTGTVIKGMDREWNAPRSLYSDLPERFGFSRRQEGPAFIECQHRVRKLRQKEKQWEWYHWAA